MSKSKYSNRIPVSEIQKTRGSLTARKLMEYPITGTIDTSVALKSHFIDLGLGSDNYISGDITQLHGATVALIHQMYVSRLLRGKGLGERLLRTFVAEAKDRGAEELWSDNISNMALRLRARIFGTAALHFYDSDNTERGFLPMTYQQAVETNDRVLSTMDPDNGEPICGDIGAYVDLRNVDTSRWPRAEGLEEVDFSMSQKV
jgi:GNAT superfamily N-acetyltransferase